MKSTLKKAVSVILALMMVACLAAVPSVAAPSSVTGYWSSKFSASGQTAYTLVVNAIRAGQTSVQIPSCQEYSRFWDTINWEHPELFYAKNFRRSSHTHNGVTTNTASWTLDSNWQSEKAAVEQAASQFLAKAPKSGSDYDKELYVHDKLANETKYDINSNNLYYSLVQHKGNCMGYAYAMKYLLNQLGVTCRVISGTGLNPSNDNKPEDHMWNVVTLNGKEYLTDACWDSTTKISKTLPHFYFNLTREEMDRTHTPKNSSEDSLCTNADQNYYKKNGMYYESVADAENAIKKNLKKGQEMSLMLPSQKEGEQVEKDFMSHKIISGAGTYSANEVINGVVIVSMK